MCPACKQPMIALELDGIEIDHCLECKGTWLDSGEIEAILDRAGVEPGRLTQVLHQARAGERTDRRCPRCRRRMRHMHLTEPTDLTLDHCPLEHGLWFDAGEMRTLVAAAQVGYERPVAAFLADLLKDEFARQT